MTPTAEVGTKKSKKKAEERPPMPAVEQRDLDLAIPFTEELRDEIRFALEP